MEMWPRLHGDGELWGQKGGEMEKQRMSFKRKNEVMISDTADRASHTAVVHSADVFLLNLFLGHSINGHVLWREPCQSGTVF